MNVFYPSIKCPCGFEARTADASELFKAHTCPKSAWPAAAALMTFAVTTAVFVWAVIAWVN